MKALIHTRPPTATDPGYELHASKHTDPAGITLEFHTHLPNVEKPHYRRIFQATLSPESLDRLVDFLKGKGHASHP